MAVLMYHGSHGRHEGADLHMPNADIDRALVAPLTSSIESSGIFYTPSKGIGR